MQRAEAGATVAGEPISDARDRLEQMLTAEPVTLSSEQYELRQALGVL